MLIIYLFIYFDAVVVLCVSCVVLNFVCWCCSFINLLNHLLLYIFNIIYCSIIVYNLYILLFHVISIIYSIFFLFIHIKGFTNSFLYNIFGFFLRNLFIFHFFVYLFTFFFYKQNNKIPKPRKLKKDLFSINRRCILSKCWY